MEGAMINLDNVPFSDRGWYPDKSPLGEWYAINKGICPNCGINFKNVPPEFNIYPHFAKQCTTANNDSC
jgi:hypothetical protein